MEAGEAIRRADNMGGVVLPAVMALIVGVYRFATIGPHWTAVVMVAGAVASWLAVSAYSASKGKQGRSWGAAAAAASMLLPWAFSLYLMAHEGAWRAYQGIAGAGVAPILIGLFWIVAGWRMLSIIRRFQRR